MPDDTATGKVRHLQNQYRTGVAQCSFLYNYSPITGKRQWRYMSNESSPTLKFQLAVQHCAVYLSANRPAYT